MPGAILAIRNYPAALLLAALLFAASLVLAAGSLGYIGGDDEGSGLGGTGKNGDFGSGGPGGSGSPDPFFTIIESTEEPEYNDRPPAVNDPEALDRAMRRIDLQSLPQRPRIPEPLPPAGFADVDQTRDRLRQAREAFRDNVLQDNELALQNRNDEIRIEIRIDEPVDTESVHDRIKPYSLPPQQHSDSRNTMKVAEGSPAPGRTDEKDEETAGESSVDPAKQRVSPERIQRPDLPPFQRTRPLQRASILAPPPRPMRI